MPREWNGNAMVVAHRRLLGVRIAVVDGKPHTLTPCWRRRRSASQRLAFMVSHKLLMYWFCDARLVLKKRGSEFGLKILKMCICVCESEAMVSVPENL
ncbi:hypothetical protein E2542_SST26364 [Spatholobus suberectus]|nr:hypothetical protein E2542_SST26364 [Spatholobus suberectus]